MNKGVMGWLEIDINCVGLPEAGRQGIFGLRKWKAVGRLMRKKEANKQTHDTWSQIVDLGSLVWTLARKTE